MATELEFKKIEAGFYRATDVAGNEIEVAKYPSDDSFYGSYYWAWSIWPAQGVSDQDCSPNGNYNYTMKECIRDAQDQHEYLGNKLTSCRFFAHDAIRNLKK
jgi:hypothetical protein